ncbi:MAG: hypothetical protein CSA33_07130 [Desulfobulbus propionicus]|nr:MAG: hypothetical protein CSA33_07130 [Desulfobulbus propionicus]
MPASWALEMLMRKTGPPLLRYTIGGVRELSTAVNLKKGEKIEVHGAPAFFLWQGRQEPAPSLCIGKIVSWWLKVLMAGEIAPSLHT